MAGESTDLHVPETLQIDGAHGVAEPVSPPVSETVDEPFVSPRERMMRSIAERAEEARGREIEYSETLQEEARDRAGIEAHDLTEPTPAPVAPVQTPPTVETPAPQGRIVNVGGQQFQVTEEQYAHLASIGAVASQAVQQAPQQAPQAPQQPQQPVPQQRRAILTDDEARQVAHRLSYGDERDQSLVIGELANVIASRVQAGPQLDPNAIVAAARQEAMQVLQQRDLQQNLATIGEEYPDIFANHTRSQLAALKLHEIRGRDNMIGVRRSDLDCYREACNLVRSDLGTVPPQPQPGQTEQNAPSVQATPPADYQRLERKRAAPRQPNAASRVATAEAQPNRPPSGSEVVEAMRRSRGQIPMQ